MKCADCRSQLSSYLDNAMDLPVRQEMTNHLEQCQICRYELEELKKLDFWVEECLKREEPPHGFMDSVLEKARQLPVQNDRRVFMLHSFWKTAVAAAVIFFILMIPLYHTTLSEEARLYLLQSQVDSFSAGNPAHEWIEELIAEFGASRAFIQSLRDKDYGWGEITIMLAMAHHLFQAQPQIYPSIEDALKAIMSSRKEGKNWGKIGRDLRFQLEPIIEQARNNYDHMKASRQEKKGF